MLSRILISLIIPLFSVSVFAIDYEAFEKDSRLVLKYIADEIIDSNEFSEYKKSHDKELRAFYDRHRKDIIHCDNEYRKMSYSIDEEKNCHRSYDENDTTERLPSDPIFAHLLMNVVKSVKPNDPDRLVKYKLLKAMNESINIIAYKRSKVSRKDLIEEMSVLYDMDNYRLVKASGDEFHQFRKSLDLSTYDGYYKYFIAYVLPIAVYQRSAMTTILSDLVEKMQDIGASDEDILMLLNDD